MTTRVVDRVDEWDQRSFSGGYAGLQELANREFSGAVRASGAELYMTKGVVVGIRGGTIDAFEGARGTALQAPSPALPLLAVMQAESDTVRDSFYSEQTPISEVDDTLSNGGFTGYVELSENVLSGDYYLVYHGGESMAVAFVGQSERLIDGEEAFETADDEVGIYEVRPVEIDPIEIPETPRTGGGTGSTAGSTSTAAAPGGGSRGSTDTQGGSQPGAGQVGSSASAGQSRAASSGGTGETTASTGGSDGATQSAAGGSVRTIPSLDPARTTLPGEQTPSQSSTPSSAARSGTASGQSGDGAGGTERAGTANTQGELTELRAEYEELRQSHQELREQYEALQESQKQVEQEAEALRDELAAVEEERTELRQELAEREESDTAATEGVEDDDGTTTETDSADDAAEMTERDPPAALAETTLLVRYDSKSEPTLADASDASVSREDIRGNLRLESYTPFDADSTLVDGQPYDAFLEASIGHQFGEWALADLPFEIDETDNSDKLAALYEALPAVDRIDFSETVQVDGAAEGEGPEFDIVLRDGHGNPLLVVTIDDEGSPTTADMTTSFVEDSTAVGESHDSLAGALLVTRSYFEGGARDFAEDVSSGGLTGESERANYVSTGGDGYHLCLGEARNDHFHLILPDL